MEVLVILVLIVIVLVIVQAIRTRTPPSARATALNQRLASVRYMTGSQFEHFVADIMRALGYRVQVLGGSGDQGVDVIATTGGERIAIQCKQYDRPIGNKPVQEVFTGAKHHRCTRSMVVAPKGFTKGAIALAKSVGVELHNIDSLRRWIGRIQPEPQEWRTVDLDAAETAAEIQPEPQEGHTKVDLDATSVQHKEENTLPEGRMQKHTISVGTDRIGETVSFTAKKLGTAHVNGGKEVNDKSAMDWTYYRLPDDTYRVLIDSGDTTLLLPSNMAEAMRRGEPVEYGRWTLEELENEGEYGRVFNELMKRHPEGRKRIVRDLD